MRCERCGKQIGNNFYKYNNAYLCPDCARETGVADMLSSSMSGAMKRMESDFMGMMPQLLSNLEFSPTRAQIKCPKCGTSLRDFETTGALGCIECYNAFNDQIMRVLMRTQANTDYVGRKPGIASNPELANEVADDFVNNGSKSEVCAKENADKLSRYENSDIGMLSDDDLRNAIKLAVEAENYMLAARFRDELKSREGN